MESVQAGILHGYAFLNSEYVKLGKTLFMKYDLNHKKPNPNNFKSI